MAKVQWEFDALYHGAAYENARAAQDWQDENAEHRVRQLAIGETPEDLPRPKPLPTTLWIEMLSVLESPSEFHGVGPFKATNFFLDVMRALSTLPYSRLAVVVHTADGYGLDEIAEMMGRDPETRGGWTRQSVRDALKQASRAVRRQGDRDEMTGRCISPHTDVVDSVRARVTDIRRTRLQRQRRAA